MVRLVGGGQWKNAYRMTTLQMFIGRNCLTVVTEDDECLDTEKFKVLRAMQSVWDVQDCIFA